MNRQEWREKNQKRRDEILAHYAESKSLRKTGAAFGICGQRVHQIVKKAEQYKETLPRE